MNALILVGAVIAGAVVLALLSIKWCLPAVRTSAVMAVAAVAALLCGWIVQQTGQAWWLVAGATGLVQIAIYVGGILWFFYRDPERQVPQDSGVVVSPADGTIVYIRQLDAGEALRSEKNGAAITVDEFRETELSRQTLWQIGISMVFTDVHVNRSPIGGVITLLAHRPGEFLSLRRKEAVNLNERQTMVISGKGVQVGLVQIASRLVRQIVAYVKKGEIVKLGQRVGVIRFGSQVDLFIPVANSLRLEVTEHQRLIAGETIICRLKD
jgi:phosphatidylserine decarboxylase